MENSEVDHSLEWAAADYIKELEREVKNMGGYREYGRLLHEAEAENKPLESRLKALEAENAALIDKYVGRWSMLEGNVALIKAENRIKDLEAVLKKVLEDCEPDDDGRLYAPRGPTWDEAVAVLNHKKQNSQKEIE